MASQTELGLLMQSEDSPVESTLKRWVGGAIVLAVLMTALGGILSWRILVRASEDADWVAHTHEVEATLAETAEDAVEVETGSRGFAVTGEEAFLALYQEGQTAVGQDVDGLRRLTADNPAQQRRLDVLKQQINATIEEETKMVTERRRAGAVPDKAVFLKGKGLMDEVHATVVEMQSEESKLLDQRTSRMREDRHLSKVITFDRTLLGVVLLILAGCGIGREIKRGSRLHEQLKTLTADLERRVEERTSALRAEVAERKRAEEEVRHLNSELEQRVLKRTAALEAANKELEAFTYSVSHDLRAPLRHISGFSKILTEEFGSSLPEEAQHHLRRIEEGTRRMGVLVDDLLNLARVGRRDLSLQVAGLRSVVDEVISALKPDLADRRVEWKIGTLPYMECDPGLMRQVLQNLLSNAVKFTRPRPQAVIEIGQEEKDGGSVVYVRDNGVGFSMKYANKLFGVFQRLHRVEDFEGTGVGLATVQRIIQKHGGRVWAEGELDKGATFYFTMGNSETIEAKAKTAAMGDRA